MSLSKNHSRCLYCKLSSDTRRQFKTLCTALLLSATCHVPSAQASMFDTLLEVLLPSYNAEDSDNVNDDDENIDDKSIDATESATSASQSSSNDNNNDTQPAMSTSNGDVQGNSVPQNTPSAAPQINSSVSVVGVNNTIADLPTSPLSQNAITENGYFEFNKPSLYNLLEAEFAIDRGNVNHGLALYKQESFTDNSASVFERALSLSMVYEPIDDSLGFSLSWQHQHPEHLPAQFYIAHLALKAHDYTLAGDILAQILAYDANADLSGMLEGIFPVDATDQRELLVTLQALPEHKNASLLTMQAGLLYQLGQFEMALYNVDLALESQPNNVPYIIQKADIMQKLQPPEQVVEFVKNQRQRLADNPNAKRLYLYEVRYLLGLGQNTSAWELLLTTHQRFSNDTEITLLAALVSIDIEEYETADKLLSGLASLPSYLDQSYYYLGVSAERQQDYQKAERYLSKVMREDLVWEARKKVVAIKLLEGDVDGALTTLKQLSERFEIYAPESTVLQAEILRQQGKLSDAKDLLALADRRYPDNLDILYARTQLLDASVNSEYAIKRSLLERLMLLNPEDTDYQLSYAKMLFADYDDRDESLMMARRIVDIPYDDPRFDTGNYIAALNLLATDALSRQEYEKVLRYLSTPYDLMPTLDSGILLLRAYQGLDDDINVQQLFIDLQQKFSLEQDDINEHLQAY